MDAHEKRHIPFNLMQAPPLIINHTQNFRGFPGGSVVKNLSDNAGDIIDSGSIPGREDPLEGKMRTQYSCQGNPTGRGA